MRPLPNPPEPRAPMSPMDAVPQRSVPVLGRDRRHHHRRPRRSVGFQRSPFAATAGDRDCALECIRRPRPVRGRRIGPHIRERQSGATHPSGGRIAGDAILAVLPGANGAGAVLPDHPRHRRHAAGCASDLVRAVSCLTLEICGPRPEASDPQDRGLAAAVASLAPATPPSSRARFCRSRRGAWSRSPPRTGSLAGGG
jgi:hypothetical protein